MKSFRAMNDDSGMQQKGFTLLELLCVVAIVGVLVALFLPATRTTRESARRTECKNRIRCLALGIHDYHDAFDQLPSAMGDGELVRLASHSDANRLSGLIAVLPYVEYGELWNQISNPLEVGGREYQAMGPPPWSQDYPPWTGFLPDFQCPSANLVHTGFGRTSFAFSIGDMAREIHQPKQLRGAFAVGLNSRFDDFSDGTSCTLLMAEIGGSDGRAVVGQFALNQPEQLLDNPSWLTQIQDADEPKEYASNIQLASIGRGGCWADGAAGIGLVNTILPPKSPSASLGNGPNFDGIYSAGSQHPAGVNVAMSDASVRTIARDVNCGDSRRPTLTSEQMAQRGRPSPYGVWGAMGTLAAADSAKE